MKRTVRRIFGLLMVCSLAAGCGQQGTEPESGGEQKNEPEKTEAAGFQPKYDPDIEGEVKIGGGFKNFEALEEIFKDFRSYYPNVATTYYSVDNQSDVLNKVMEGEEAPDIIFSSSYIWDYSDQYAQVQEHALVISDPDLDIDMSMIKDALLLKNQDGDVVFYPAFIQSSGVMVNEKILEEQGIDLPTTYPEFLDACEKLKAAGCTHPIVGCRNGDGWEALYPALAQGFFTESIYQKKEAVAAINSNDPGSAEYLRSTLEFVKEFVDKDLIDTEVSETLGDGYESVILRFFEGDIPFMFTNTNTMTGTAKRENKSENFQKNPFEYCFIPFPYDADGGILPVRDMFGFTVNKDAPNRDLAVEFMRFLSQKDTLDKLCDLKGAPRITKDAEQQGHLKPLTAYEDRIICDGQASLTRNEAEAVRKTINIVGMGGSVEEAMEQYYELNPGGTSPE